jgi:hypothetical protein
MAATAEIIPMPRKMGLYDIALEGAILEDLIVASEGELTPEIEERLEKLLQQGPDRIEAAAKVVRNLEAYEEACKAEAQRLTERAKMFRSNIDRLKERMRGAVDFAFGGKVKTARFTIWTQKAADTVSVELAEGFTAEMVKEDYPSLVKTEYSLDKAQAKILWDRHGNEVKAATAVLADPEETEERKTLARNAMSLVPECLSITENPGKRFIRIK